MDRADPVSRRLSILLQLMTRMPGKHFLALALVGGVSLGAGSTAASAQRIQPNTAGMQPQTNWLTTVTLTKAPRSPQASALCLATARTVSTSASLTPLTQTDQADDLLGALSCATTPGKDTSSAARVIEGPTLSFSLDQQLLKDRASVRRKPLPIVVPAITVKAHTTYGNTARHTKVVAHVKAPTVKYVPRTTSYAAPPSGIGPWTPVPGHPSYGLGNFSGDPYSGAYGTCTWYAWYRHRNEPLMQLGNAAQWAYNAPKHGLRVGYTPVVGATVIFQPGVQGAGGAGHAGHVEAVLGGGWFIISEMNFSWNGGGFGRVDYRYVHTGSGVSFIY